MGIFSGIGSFVREQMTERQKRKAIEKEEAEARRAALHKARMEQAPEFARQQAKLESQQRLKQIKSGKSTSPFGNLQDIAHGIGQSTGTAFQRDFDTMFGGGRVSKAPSSGYGNVPNAMTAEFNQMFGGKKPTTRKTRRKKRRS